MRKIFAGVLLVLSLIIFGISAFYIGNYLMQEKKTDDTYEILRDILDSDEDKEQDDANLESGEDIQAVEIDEGLKNFTRKILIALAGFISKGQRLIIQSCIIRRKGSIIYIVTFIRNTITAAHHTWRKYVIQKNLII